MPRLRGILRLLFWSGVAISAALSIALWWITSPAFLRSAVQPLLARLPWPVTVAHVSLSYSQGLQLIDVVIQVPDSEPAGHPSHTAQAANDFAPLDSGAAGETLLADVRTAPSSPRLDSQLRIASLTIECSLLDLLRGDVRPRQIRLRGVSARLVARPWSTNLGLALRERERLGFWRPAVVRAFAARWFPPLRLEDADVEIFLEDGDRPRLAHRLRLHGRGQPEEDGYTLRLGGLTTTGERLVELHWRRSIGELHAATDWIDLEWLTPWMPEAIRSELLRLDLHGRVQLEYGSFCLDPTPLQLGQPGELVLRFDRLQAEYPLGAERDRPAGAPPYLRLTDGAGRLVYEPGPAAEPGRVTLAGAGRLHEAPLVLRATADTTTAFALLEGRRPGAAALYFAELKADGLRIPTARADPDVVSAPELPRAVQQFLEDYRPSGPLNIHARIAPGAAADAPPHVLIDFEAVDCGLRYHKFPYEFANVRGRVRMVNERIFLEGLHGRHGAARARVDGYVSNTEAWAEIDLAIRAENLSLDADLYRALSPSYRRLWHTAAPLGICDATVVIRRPLGSPEAGAQETFTDVDLRLLRGSLWLDEDLRIENASGYVSVRDEGVTFHDLHGSVNGAEVRIAGIVQTESAPPGMAMNIDLVRWPVTRQAMLAGGRLEFDGLAHVWGRAARAAGAAELEQFFTARLYDGQLRGFDPGQVWTPCRGWVTTSGSAQRVVSFHAARSDAWIEASGVLPSGNAPPPASAVGTGAAAADAPFSLAELPAGLSLRAGGPELTQILRQFLPPDWARHAAELQLSGAGEISARTEARASAEAQPAGSAATSTHVHLQAERARPRPFPLELRAVSAVARFHAAGFELLEARGGLSGGGQIEATGAGRWDAGQDTVELRVNARDLEFSAALLEALPGALGRTIAALTPRGDFDAQFERVAWRSTPLGPEIEIRGALALRGAALDVGLVLDGLDGELRGSCRVTPAGESELDCTLFLARGTLAGREIERLEGRLVRRIGDPVIELRELRGLYCGGQAIADVRVDPTDSQYELTLTFQDVSMDGFFALADGAATPPSEPRPGRLDGTIFLRGRGGATAGRRGGGTLRIRGASLVQTPVLPAVLEQQPGRDERGSAAVDTVDMRFTLSGTLLEFQRIELLSRDLRLVGEGRWNLADDGVRLTLVGANPRDWPRVALLSDLFERAGQELMQYRVEGTLAKPRVTVEPLQAVTSPLRKLLIGD